MQHKQTQGHLLQCLTILNKVRFLLALTFAFMVQPTPNSILAQTVGYPFQVVNQLHLHLNPYQQRMLLFPKTVSWDLGKIGTQVWGDKYDIKPPVLHHVENSQLVGLVYPCFLVLGIKELSILSYMNPPTILRTTYNQNHHVFLGKEVPQLREFTMRQGYLQLPYQVEIQPYGRLTMMLGDGLHLDLQSFQYSLGIRWVIPWQ